MKLAEALLLVSHKVNGEGSVEMNPFPSRAAALVMCKYLTCPL